jgi:6-phospho-3-hexuloisomerase
MTPSWSDSAALIDRETQRCLTSIDGRSFDQLSELLSGQGRRVFLLGEGRSGLAAKMFAMRLMHLGLTAFVVGETTTPSLASGDLLIAVSGSGSKGVVYLLSSEAKHAGATLVVFTVNASSPLGELADLLITIPAAAKTDRAPSVSEQFAGSLFEQTVLLSCDALFHSLSHATQQGFDELWARHTNLE